jgi:hypothetical protein
MEGRIKKKRKFESVLAVAEPSTSTGEAIHIPARQCTHIYAREEE